MGVLFKMKCKDCGTKWKHHQGQGAIASYLHCDRCGKEKVFFNGEENTECDTLYCNCGGTFKEEEYIICPKCQSVNVDYDSDWKGRIKIITFD